MLCIGNDPVIAFMLITVVPADTESDTTRSPETLEEGGYSSESSLNNFFRHKRIWNSEIIYISF
jgi:hypothetical protein